MENDDDGSKLEFIEIKDNTITGRANIADCVDGDPKIYKDQVKVQGESLFLHVTDSDNEEHYFVRTKISFPDKKTLSVNCTEINNAFFGKHRVYLYKMEGKHSDKIDSDLI